MLEAVEHRARDRRDAGHHVDVADLESGRARDRVVDQAAADRHLGHLEPRRRQVGGIGVAPLHDRHRVGMAMQHQVERLGDAAGGDVVVRRTDAAGGEQIGVALAQRIHRGDDVGLDVGDHPHLHEPDAELGQLAGQVRQVGVGGAARQDLVANDHDGSGNGSSLRFGHLPSKIAV